MRSRLSLPALVGALAFLTAAEPQPARAEVIILLGGTYDHVSATNTPGMPTASGAAGVSTFYLLDFNPMSAFPGAVLTIDNIRVDLLGVDPGDPSGMLFDVRLTDAGPPPPTGLGPESVNVSTTGAVINEFDFNGLRVAFQAGGNTVNILSGVTLTGSHDPALEPFVMGGEFLAVLHNVTLTAPGSSGPPTATFGNTGMGTPTADVRFAAFIPEPTSLGLWALLALPWGLYLRRVLRRRR